MTVSWGKDAKTTKHSFLFIFLNGLFKIRFMKKNAPFYIITCFLILLSAFSCRKGNPVVEIQTPKGIIAVELYVDKAPVTAGNFLALVEKKILDGGSFYRTVRAGTTRIPSRLMFCKGEPKEKQMFLRSARLNMKLPNKPESNIWTGWFPWPGLLRDRQGQSFLSASAISPNLISAGGGILMVRGLLHSGRWLKE
jgi:hypothetical protein